jgi:molybdopterin synthase catalytic subunit
VARLIRVVDGTIDFDEALAAVAAAENGGVVTFRGDTRNHAEGRVVTRLFYEAYEPMASEKMAAIADDVEERWAIRDFAMVHRVGEVPIGEASIFIVAASPHRAESFAACRYAIDTLKHTVPIWKKEYFEGGEMWIGETPGATRSDAP